MSFFQVLSAGILVATMACFAPQAAWATQISDSPSCNGDLVSASLEAQRLQMRLGQSTGQPCNHASCTQAAWTPVRTSRVRDSGRPSMHTRYLCWQLGRTLVPKYLVTLIEPGSAHRFPGPGYLEARIDAVVPHPPRSRPFAALARFQRAVNQTDFSGQTCTIDRNPTLGCANPQASTLSIYPVTSEWNGSSALWVALRSPDQASGDNAIEQNLFCSQDASIADSFGRIQNCGLDLGWVTAEYEPDMGAAFAQIASGFVSAVSGAVSAMQIAVPGMGYELIFR